MITFNSTAVSRFWAKVDKNGPVPEHRPDLGNCWVWTGQVNNKGYGLFKPASYHKMAYTHRVSWIFAYGEIPDGSFVLHRCDRPACLRPEHLRLGDRTDNARDMAAKLRGNTAKLSADNIEVIRSIYVRGRRGDVKDLAERFGISRSNVRHVGQRESFKDIGSDIDRDGVFIAGSDTVRPPAMNGSQIVGMAMRTHMDLTGHIYGRLTVVREAESAGNGDYKWECVCSCGKTCISRMTNLRTGTTRSCGCLNDEKRRSKQPPLEERFWPLVDKRTPDECWPWLGSLQEGYGSIKRKGKKMGAHRAAWEIAHPDEPPLSPIDVICHKCNFPTCVNFSHLFRANATINNFDRDVKAAFKDWTFTHTQILIMEIKGLRANGLRYSEITAITGVRPLYVKEILSGKHEI